MTKLLTILLFSISLNGVSQTELDAAISNLKKIYAENVKPPYQSKIYFNKAQKLIDVGRPNFQIPITADVVYNLDTSYYPPQNVLVFSWKAESESNFPTQEKIEKSIIIIFKTKDACYDIIDAIVRLRELIKHGNNQ